MRKMNCSAPFYGFEDYRLFQLGGQFFVNDGNTYYCWLYSNGDGTIIPKDIVNTRITNISWHQVGFPDLLVEKKDILDTADKLYIHNCCKLPRTNVYVKYSKCLNPWMADAVVIPDGNDFYGIKNYCTAIFIDENKKILYSIIINDPTTLDAAKVACSNKIKLKDVSYSDLDLSGHIKDVSKEDVENAELLYFGEVLYIPWSLSYVEELITGALPKDKLVFETTLQNSLASSDNVITCEDLVNIKDMLLSPDDSVVSAALKALSVLDWIHYPETVKKILNDTLPNWRYNKVLNSTSVKYMFKALSGNGRIRRYLRLSNSVSEKDYKLLEEWYLKVEKVEPAGLLYRLHYDLNFVSKDYSGKLVVHFKS